MVESAFGCAGGGMTAGTFTPGPWAVAPSGDNGIPSVKAIDPADGRRFEVCEVWGENIDTDETPMSRANARLIAAAPDQHDLNRRFVAAMRKGADGASVGKGDVIWVRVSDWHRLLDLANEAKELVARATGEA